MRCRRHMRASQQTATQRHGSSAAFMPPILALASATARRADAARCARQRRRDFFIFRRPHICLRAFFCLRECRQRRLRSRQADTRRTAMRAVPAARTRCLRLPPPCPAMLSYRRRRASARHAAAPWRGVDARRPPILLLRSAKSLLDADNSLPPPRFCDGLSATSIIERHHAQRRYLRTPRIDIRQMPLRHAIFFHICPRRCRQSARVQAQRWRNAPNI